MNEHGFYNLDAEKSVLAAMMKTGIAGKYISQLTPEDFYKNEHRALYMAMQGLYIQKKPIDLPLMDDMLGKQNGDAAKFMSVLIELMKTHSFAAEFSVCEHIRLVREASRRRALYRIIEKARGQLMDASCELQDIACGLKTGLKNCENAPSVQEAKTLQEVLMSTYTELEERCRGIDRGMPSGIDVLDRVTAGFHRGEFTIVGARPAVGKSAFAAQAAIGAAENGYKVLICSREMTDIQYGIRILARGTKVSNLRMRTGNLSDQDWQELSQSITRYDRNDIRFIFDAKYIEDLNERVWAMKERFGLDMLIVDYIQLMQTRQKADKDYQRIGYISKALKDLSTDLNIAVIGLAQVGRGTDGSMPSLADLRGSGDLEQDADNVIFIHRPMDAYDDYVKPEHRGLFGNLGMTGSQYLALNLAKHRQGETGVTVCLFRPASMTFRGIERGNQNV